MIPLFVLFPFRALTKLFFTLQDRYNEAAALLSVAVAVGCDLDLGLEVELELGVGEEGILDHDLGSHVDLPWEGGDGEVVIVVIELNMVEGWKGWVVSVDVTWEVDHEVDGEGRISGDKDGFGQKDVC